MNRWLCALIVFSCVWLPARGDEPKAGRTPAPQGLAQEDPKPKPPGGDEPGDELRRAEAKARQVTHVDALESVSVQNL